MSRMLRITEVMALRTGLLRVTWDDGVTRDVDVTDLLSGHVLLDMLNIPEVFADVSVVEWGGGVEWRNGADFSAQTLRMHSDEQTTPLMKMKA